MYTSALPLEGETYALGLTPTHTILDEATATLATPTLYHRVNEVTYF